MQTQVHIVTYFIAFLNTIPHKQTAYVILAMSGGEWTNSDKLRDLALLDFCLGDYSPPPLSTPALLCELVIT